MFKISNCTSSNGQFMQKTCKSCKSRKWVSNKLIIIIIIKNSFWVGFSFSENQLLPPQKFVPGFVLRTWGLHTSPVPPFIREGLFQLQLLAISLQACNFTKMNFFKHISQGFYLDLSYSLLCFRIQRTLVFQSTFQWLLLLVLIITQTPVH